MQQLATEEARRSLFEIPMGAGLTARARLSTLSPEILQTQEEEAEKGEGREGEEKEEEAPSPSPPQWRGRGGLGAEWHGGGRGTSAGQWCLACFSSCCLVVHTEWLGKLSDLRPAHLCLSRSLSLLQPMSNYCLLAENSYIKMVSDANFSQFSGQLVKQHPC